MTLNKFLKLLHFHAVVLLAIVAGLSGVLWISSSVHAGSLSGASVTLGDPQLSQSGVNYSFSFTVSSAVVLQSFRGQVCTTASGVCVTPSGFSAAAATLSTQPTGYGSSTGWQDDSVSGAFQITNASNATPPSGTQQIVFANATNPDTAGTFFIRLTIYSDSNYATEVDSAAIAYVIVPGIVVSATVDPTLTFSVDGVPPATTYKGALATSDRCVTTAGAVNFGSALLPLAPNTDYDCAQTLTTGTNANQGYQVVIKNLGAPTLQNSSNSATLADWIGTNTLPSSTPNGSNELFGYTTTDGRLSGTADRFTSSDNLFAGLTTSDAEVARAYGSVANDTVNIGFRLRFTTLSAAGTYTGKVVYTCTPTF